MSISGNTVAIWNASGRHNVALVNQSGNLSVTVEAGNYDGYSATSNNFLYGVSTAVGVDSVGGGLNRLRTTASGSSMSAGGTQFKLLTAISGDVVNIEGQTVMTSISGNVIKTCPCDEIKSPIVKTENIQLQSGLNYLPNKAVSSGVILSWAFPGTIANAFVGGVSGFEASYSGAGVPVAPHVGIGFANGGQYPITNLNQLSIYIYNTDVSSGPLLNYFTYYISG